MSANAVIQREYAKLGKITLVSVLYGNFISGTSNLAALCSASYRSLAVFADLTEGQRTRTPREGGGDCHRGNPRKSSRNSTVELTSQPLLSGCVLLTIGSYSLKRISHFNWFQRHFSSRRRNELSSLMTTDCCSQIDAIVVDVVQVDGDLDNDNVSHLGDSLGYQTTAVRHRMGRRHATQV